MVAGTLGVVDILELQRKCREIAESRKVKEVRDKPSKDSAKGSHHDRRGFLKDYPGQVLSREEFQRRLRAYKERLDTSVYHQVAHSEFLGTPKRPPWKLRFKRK